jgi:hypothetical protein
VGEKQERLIEKAIEKHERIRPCSNRTELRDCFSVLGNKLIFWYNTDDDSTHVLVDEI